LFRQGIVDRKLLDRARTELVIPETKPDPVSF
jgi:hypothetical protein